MNEFRSPQGLLSALAPCLAVLAALLLVWAPAPAAEREEARALLDWFDEMEAYYEANPELKTTPGSGWKPYNRYRWFHEQRMIDGKLPPVGARWEAWQEKRRRESQVTPRATWFSLGPTNFAGRMLALDFDPTDASTVYTGGADGGVWKSTDSGATWMPMSDELPSIAVGGLAVSKTNPDVIVIGTGEGTPNIDRVGGVGILRSTDAGLTWITTDLNYAVSSGHGFHVVEAGPNGTFLAGATDGLYRSSDDGATWTQVRTGGDHYDVKWKPGDPNTVFTVKGRDSAGNNVKISTDDGLTFTLAGTGQPPTFQIGKSKLAVTAANPQVVYALFGQGGTGGGTTGVYRTTDGGATWNPRNTTTNIGGGQAWYNLSLTCDPNNQDLVIGGGVQLFRSTNGGTTFGTIGGGVHVDHHVAAYEPGSNSNVWVGSDGGLWRSTNDGGTFTDRNNGLVTYQFYDICVNNNNATPYYIMGGTQDNGTDKWSGTTTWANGLGADGMVCNINPNNGTTVYAEIQFGGHRKNLSSGTGGWSSIMNGIFGSALWVAPVDEDQNSGNHLYTSTNAGIFRTLNGGNNWVNVDGVPATWISISPVNGNYIWTVSGTPRYTTDDGGSWSFASGYGFPVGGATKILAHPTDLNTAFVTFSGYSAVSHVAMTTDLGATWMDVTGDLPPQPVNAIVVNPSNTNQWFIGTDVGVWASENGGVNWLPFEAGLPNAVVVDLEIQNALQKLVAGTHGRGAWEIDIPATIGTDAPVVAAPTSLKLMLDAPFPNPTSDRTLLRWAARHDGPVTLAVYDVAGRLVTPVEELATGDGVIRTSPWFANDVPSGVYFAVLRAGDLSESKKIIVAK